MTFVTIIVKVVINVILFFKEELVIICCVIYKVSKSDFEIHISKDTESILKNGGQYDD